MIIINDGIIRISENTAPAVIGKSIITPYISVAIVFICGKPTNRVPCASSIEPRNVNTLAIAIPGIARGRLTWRNVWNALAPTSLAASSCSFLTFHYKL